MAGVQELQNGTTGFGVSMLGLSSFRFINVVGPTPRTPVLLQLLNSFP